MWKRLFNFKNGTRISSAQANQELDQLIAAVNDIEDADNQKDIELRKIAQLSKMTFDNGGVKLSVDTSTGDILEELVKLGKGFHTFFATGGSKNLPPNNISIRGFAHMTSTTYGYAMAFDFRTQVWINFYENGQWKGWRKLTSQTSEDDQEKLWEGVMYLNENQTVKPSKPLNECKTGWILAWSRFVPGDGENNTFWHFVHVPKKFGTITSGGMVHPLYQNPNGTALAGAVPIFKYIYCTNTQITGNAFNGEGDRRYAVLRFVFEY